MNFTSLRKCCCNKYGIKDSLNFSLANFERQQKVWTLFLLPSSFIYSSNDDYDEIISFLTQQSNSPTFFQKKQLTLIFLSKGNNLKEFPYHLFLAIIFTGNDAKQKYLKFFLTSSTNSKRKKDFSETNSDINARFFSCDFIINQISKKMGVDDLLDKVKQEANQGALSAATINELKKFFDEMKNSQSTQMKPIEFLLFKEKVFGYIVQILNEGKLSQKEKTSILQLLERDLISTKYNVQLFNKLYYCLVNEDQNIAILASKAIDVLVKQINEKGQKNQQQPSATQGAVPLEIKAHYLKLFEFLKQKTDFLLKLSEHAKGEQFKAFRRQPYEQTREKEKDKQKKETVFKNSKSLKFINQVPHLFIHLMAYTDFQTKNPDDHNKVKELIRKSNENIILALRKTPYKDFYNQFNYDFNNELFSVMTKLLQFLFINLRNDKEDRNREQTRNNQNLKRHIAQQIEHIKVSEVIRNFIYLLKNCSEDFPLHRYEIANRLKLLLCNLDKTKLNRADAIQILDQLLNEETIYGKKKTLGDYSKNAICSFWVEMIKTPVLLSNVFSNHFLSIRAVSNGGLSEDSHEIAECFGNIQRLLEEVLKTIFDNSIFPSIQEKCIQLLTIFVDHLFPEGPDHCDSLSSLSNSPTAKKVHENKLKILMKMLQCASLKFQSMRNVFEEIDMYVTKKLGHRATKKELPEPLKLEHMQLNSLEISLAETDKWNEKVVQYIQNYDDNISTSLLTGVAIPNKFLTIYEDDDELCFNSHPVKMNNYTLYMREIKIKLIERCITLSHRLTKTFLVQNLENYSQSEIQSLKTIYFSISAKKSLTQEQCSILSSILKNGLKIFEILHYYDLHSDEQSNKKGHLKNFMFIFAQVYDPVNFRDIFQPNMDEFFRNLVLYAKHCADFCLQYVLIEPFCSSNNQSQPFNKNIVQLLIYNLILRLQSTSDVLDPFHEFYGYKQEYFSLLQKLIRFPFRCLSRYSDDSFIRNYFRQIILFLIKKSHSSRFCLDYLHLMRTLFKNILFNCNRESASPLFSEFYALCMKNSTNTTPQTHSIFVNVNVLDNFALLYDTGIPELADIVTELIIMLPLKSKHIIHFARQGYIVKPLLHCLCLMSDYNYTLRTLKTFEIIISHSNAEEINSFLDGMKEKLIERLYHMVGECKVNDLKPEKINNDLSALSLKLLAKLGCLSRAHEMPLIMKPKDQEEPELKMTELELVYSEMKTSKCFKVSMDNAIEYALEIFQKLIDPYYQSTVFVSMDIIEKCFGLLRESLSLTISKMHPLSERIIGVFSRVLSLHSKYLTVSPSILQHIRGEIKTIISDLAENIKLELLNFGLNEYCKFFIRTLITNISERVLITREDNFVKEFSEEPKKFLWDLIKRMLNTAEDTNSYNETYQYLIRLLISQVIMVNNPEHFRLNPFHHEYNHVLPYKNAALSCLSEIIDTAPLKVLDDTQSDILQAVFIVVATVPDILNLKIMEHPPVIAKKIYNNMLRDEKEFLKFLQTDQGEKTFHSILENLVTYSTQAHKISSMFLHKIMNETEIHLPELLYASKWEDIQDRSSPLTKYQAKYTLDEIVNANVKKCPLISLAKNLVRISHNISEESLKNNNRMIKMMSNSYLTFELLISLKHKDKTYHAFSIMNKTNDTGDITEQNCVFESHFDNILEVGKKIIQINSRLYGNYTKIIVEPQSNHPQNPTSHPPNQQPPPSRNPANRELPRVRENNNPPNSSFPYSSSSQAFNINSNTFIDDEEYGLNVEDFDMEIKVWSELISSILKFMKSVLINDTVFNLSKSMQRKKLDKCPIIQKRNEIIFSMFELIGRVERSVRETAYQSVKELLSREDHPKDLIQNDDKLKTILRPVLLSLQLDFKKFTPSFLHMFKKILKLLTQCFNITLIQKLVDKLREIQRIKEQQNPINSIAPKLMPQNNQKPSNYSEITCQVKCIANFLGLFEHLGYAYFNHKSPTFAINSIIVIFKFIISICDYFIPKLGRHTIKIYIKKTLAKVMNTLCEKISGDYIFIEGIERQIDLDSFLEIIELDDSFPLREKLIRESNYIEKAFTDYSKNQSNKKDYILFLQIVLVLAERNNKWMKGFTTLAQKMLIQLNHCIQTKKQRRDEIQPYEGGEKNEVILLAKILLQYIKQNREDLEVLFGLANLFRIRSGFDFHFLRIYFKYELYWNISPEMRRRIFNRYFRMYRDSEHEKDTQKILVISQNIIYEFVLIQIQPEQKRSILIRNTEVIGEIIQTVKVNLNPKLLHSRNANNYREAVEILMITNLAMSALKDTTEENEKSQMLLNIWGLLRMEDKTIKHYAYVWVSNYIHCFDALNQSKVLGIYLILVRGLEGLGAGDYEIGALIKKSLNILIPYWDRRPRDTQPGNWIDMSLRAVHEESNEPNRLVRFWEIVVKNHEIFNKFKQAKFETQMVNNMQYLMITNNPSSNNPLVKKISSDMSFIYIEWKFKEVKEKLKDIQDPEQKARYLETNINSKAAEICLNFFIKVALNNCNEKDDKEIMKRSLYLLKKTLILWPNTVKKFDGIKSIINKQKNAAGTTSSEVPLRFHYTLLNIINILLMYEPNQKVATQLTAIFKLLELGQVTPPRMPTNNPNHPSVPSPGTVFTSNNIYLLNLLCTIVKRLVKIALSSEKEEESIKLLNEIHTYIKDGFDYYILATNKSRNGQQTQPTRAQAKKIQVEVAICFLKILFDLDPKSAEIHLNNIKQVASSLKKMFEKGFENNKNSNPNRVYEFPPLTEGTFEEMLNKDLEINIDLIKADNMTTAEENYEKDNIKSYGTRRPLFVVLLRILAAKINDISASEDQGNAIDIFLAIYQKIPDPELKIQVINILKCLFIGPKAFPSGVPERYKNIPIINYDEKKIFYLLMEDNSKFHEHFQRRKLRLSDQNYNISEKLYEQITTKLYFDFLCIYLANLKQITNEYLLKIRVFILYALKVASTDLIEKVFDILDKKYYRNRSALFLTLFDDYRDLSCDEEYLQGDEVMILFTTYLYKKSLPKTDVELRAYGVETSPEHTKLFLSYYEQLIKADQSCKFHLNMIGETLKMSILMLEQPNCKLSMIMKDYLLTGSYNDQWGSIILKLVLDYGNLSEEELFAINNNIVDWGQISKHCEGRQKQSSKALMDYVYRCYGDRDLICGYRMCLTRSPILQKSLAHLQQRKYIKAMTSLQEWNTAKRRRLEQEEDNANFQKQMDKIYANDILKQCYKNLNQWDEIEKDKSDTTTKVEALFHCNGNKTKINSIITDLQESNLCQFDYHYGKSVLHFLESGHPPPPNKDLNIAMFYSLVEWLCFPKNARCKQNEMLIKVQCLLELEEGEKIKDETTPSSTAEHGACLETLAKVVQSVFTQINSWRQRMPHKNEDLTVWYSILGQRNIIYDNIRKKIHTLYESTISSAPNINPTNFSKPDKLLLPYTDIEWNNLKLRKQKRKYDFYSTGDRSVTPSTPFLDEYFVKEKEKFKELMYHKRNEVQALKVLDESALTNSGKDEQLQKIQKVQLIRLKCKILTKEGKYDEANYFFNEAWKSSEQSLLALWRDWMLMNIKAFEAENKKEWALSAIATLPYTLRHKPHKTKLLIAPIFRIIETYKNDDMLYNTLESIVNHIPTKPLFIWLPQIIQLAESHSKISKFMTDILERLLHHYFQKLFFLIKPLLFKNKELGKGLIFTHMKRIAYHLVSKLEKFSQLLTSLKNEQKISVMTLSQFSQSFTEIHVPLYDVDSSKIPYLIQVSEKLETEVMNNKKGKVVNFLASDGKEYQFRIESVEKSSNGKEYEALMVSSTLEIMNQYLKLNNESSSRNLKILEREKLYLKEDLVFMKSSKFALTLLDTLNDYLIHKTTFTPEYPETDKMFQRLPKMEMNRCINKRMREIIPETVFKDYVLEKAPTFDEFISFRKMFAYQYGAILACNYVLGVEAYLHNYHFNLRTGLIEINDFKFNYEPTRISEYSVRLTRNITSFLQKVYLNANVLPAFAATISSLNNPKLDFKSYLYLLYEDLGRINQVSKVNLFERIEDLQENYGKIRKIFEVAQNIAKANDIPHQLKYWF